VRETAHSSIVMPLSSNLKKTNIGTDVLLTPRRWDGYLDFIPKDMSHMPMFWSVSYMPTWGVCPAPFILKPVNLISV